MGRDHSGHVHFVKGRRVPGMLTPHLSELIVIKEGVTKAVDSGWAE